MKELNTNQWKNVIDQITDMGCLFLLITGGEPLLRPDFQEIYLYAKSKGLILSLYTNGTLLTDQIVDVLVDNPPFVIEISLYGASSMTYEKITQKKGSFEKCIKNIKKLTERKIVVRLKTVLLTLNKKELGAIKKLSMKLGASSFRFDPIINPRLDGDSAPLNYRLDPSQVVEYEVSDSQRWTDMKDFINDYKSSKLNSEKNYLYTCGAGVRMFHVDPYGEVGICINARNETTNILNNRFIDIWNNQIKETIYKESNHFECKGCKYLAICDRCSDWALLETGKLDGKINFACQIVKKRYKITSGEK